MRLLTKQDAWGSYLQGNIIYSSTDSLGGKTFRGKAVDRLAAYEDTGLEPEEITAAANRRHDCKIDCLLKKYNEAVDELEAYRALGALDHLRELVQAERDGRLVVLPCKVGDTVWSAFPICGISSHQIREFRRTEEGDFCCSALMIPIEDFGKTVFLTREEAEAALNDLS